MTRLIPRQRLHLEAHQLAPLAAEFDPNEVNGLVCAPVPVGIALGLDLLQGTTLGG